MPKGHSFLEADVRNLTAALAAAIERIADLERRLEKANEYFQKGYVPPNV